MAWLVRFLAVRHNSRRMRNSSLDRCFSCWHTVKYKTVPPFLIGAEHMFCINYSTWFHKREEKELRKNCNCLPFYICLCIVIVAFIPPPTRNGGILHIAKLNGRLCGAKRPHSVSEQPNFYQSLQSNPYNDSSHPSGGE